MTEKREFQDWEKRYQEEEIEAMPWFHPALDHDFDRTLKAMAIARGSVLDLGTGPGTQAIALAKRGFEVTASDISETAVKKARLRTKEEGLTIDFLQDDILKSRLEGGFDLVLDRGCFHVIAPEQRNVYVETIHRLLVLKGHLFLKCFSHLEPGDEGPYRFTTQQISNLFASMFDIVSIEDSFFEGNHQPSPKALFCVLKKH